MNDFVKTNQYGSDHRIVVCLHKQKLFLQELKSSNSYTITSYNVSTAANGAGEIEHSECTPRGRHKVADKIGEDCPLNTVFVGRQAISEIYSSNMREKWPNKDYILTRIIRLEGTEDGFNKGKNVFGQVVDSFSRYIYIHGTPDDVNMKIPGSRGCIRMYNHDIIDLFEKIDMGDEVMIVEHSDHITSKILS